MVVVKFKVEFKKEKLKVVKKFEKIFEEKVVEVKKFVEEKVECECKVVVEVVSKWVVGVFGKGL